MGSTVARSRWRLGSANEDAGSFATEQAPVTLLYGLVAFGQIRFRRIDGYRKLPVLLRERWTQAA